MPEELPKSVAELKRKIGERRAGETRPADDKKVAELRNITDALVLLLEQREHKAK